MLSTLYADGWATHCGKTDGYASHCMFLGDFQYNSGEVTFTCANGDQINLTYGGTAAFTSETDLEWHGTGGIAGGTGRFAAATGKVIEGGEASLITLAGTEHFIGTIKY